MASVEGKLTARREALVTLRVVAGAEVECLVDTGATLALVLPAHMVERLGLPLVGYDENITLAGGIRTGAPIALAQVEWLGEVVSVEVIVQEDFIIGTELLGHGRLVIDYPAGTVTIFRK